MNRLRIIPLDDSVVFPGMPVTLPVDVGSDDRVLLVPRQQNIYSKVGIVAEVSDRMRLAGRGVAVALTGLHRATLGSASADIRRSAALVMARPTLSLCVLARYRHEIYTSIKKLAGQPQG